MSKLKAKHTPEAASRQTSVKTGAAQTQANLAKTAREEKLRKSLGTEVYEASRRSLARFGKLYKMLAK